MIKRFKRCSAVFKFRKKLKLLRLEESGLGDNPASYRWFLLAASSTKGIK